MTAAERATAAHAMAECLGLPWREEWVVDDSARHR